jgi:hypothetical protein
MQMGGCGRAFDNRQHSRSLWQPFYVLSGVQPRGLWQFISIAHSLLPCTANKTKTTFIKGNRNPQLIMMLHGMGRSRKRALSLPLFWLMPWNIAKFSKHPICTIAITALSSVAAALILHGGMTHTAMGLKKESVTLKMVEAWDNTCLVLLTIACLLPCDVFKKIQECAGQLKPS